MDPSLTSGLAVLTARHERAYCAAHQAVENGLKGLIMALGQQAWGRKGVVPGLQMLRWGGRPELPPAAAMAAAGGEIQAGQWGQGQRLGSEAVVVNDAAIHGCGRIRKRV
jgi:hypothetical protein